MNFLLKKHFIFLAIVAVFIIIFSIKQKGVEAQSYTPVPGEITEIKEQIDINVSPENPKPGDLVTINLETYSLDIDSTEIVWFVNGKQTLKGVGEKRFSFQVGDSIESKIVVNIYPKNQPKITKTFVFNPSNIDLLWQAETYTPPFYKGKALFSAESAVTMVAIPNFVENKNRTPDSSVVYKWIVNREVQGDYSGRGKNSFKYNSDILSQDTVIEVETYPVNNSSKKGSGLVELSEKNSFVLFYEDNPTNGIMFNYSLKNQVDLKNKKEAKISVFPYNFSTNNKNSGLNYTWYINSEKISLPSNTSSIIVKQNDKEKTDSARILIDVINPKYITQSTKNVLDFVFGNK